MKYLLFLIITFNTLSYYKNEFPTDYIQARKSFRNLFPNYKIFRVPSETDKDLTIDYSYHNARNSRKLLVINSGIHGPEGHAGSAAIKVFKEKIFIDLVENNISILIIHAMNPFGYKYHRRFTENNVDLNRNQAIDEKLFKTLNAPYNKLKEILVPQGKVSGYRIAFYKTLFSIAKKLIAGMKFSKIREATAKGQYHDPKGLFYGGNKLEPNSEFIQKLLRDKFQGKKDIFFIDFHTGLGDRAKLHLITPYFKNKKSKELTLKLFSNGSYYNLTSPDSKGFYRASGDLLGYVNHIAAKDATVISFAAEFGTLGKGIFSQVDTINRIILENQGHFYGYESDFVKEEIMKQYIELFLPEPLSWKIKATDTMMKLFEGPVLNWALQK